MNNPFEKGLLKGARAIAASAVAAAAWLFAGAEPWAYLFLCLLVGAGTACWLLALISAARPRLRAPLLTGALVLLLAFAFAQTVPLSYAMVRPISALSAEVHAERETLFHKMGSEEFLPADLKEGDGEATISAAAGGTRRSVYVLAACIGVFLVMTNACTEWAQLRRACGVIAVSSFLLVVVALMQKFSGADKIFWFHTPRYGGAIFGPFTNRNHFAAHASMVFGLTLGLFLVAVGTLEARRFADWRERVVWFSGRQGVRIVLLGFAAGLAGATLCVTLSRGGVTSLVGAIGIVALFALFRKSSRKGLKKAGAIAAVVLAGVLWLGWAPVVARLGTLASAAADPLKNSRIVAARDTLGIFRKLPLAGCGFGSFQHVFPMFQSKEIQSLRWTHTHNDYVQLLAEGGIVGTLLVVLAAILYGATAGKQFSGTAREGRLMVQGTAIGIMAVALHSLVDYGLHKPANAFLFAALCGALMAAVHLRKEAAQRSWHG